MWNCVIYNL